MFAHLIKGIASLYLSFATAVLATLSPAAVVTPSTETADPKTASELSTSLHDKITDLRSEVELAHLEASIPSDRTYNLGSKGSAVKSLQGILVELGYLTPDLQTGYYGSATKNAVTDLQDAYTLSKTGVVDTDTLTKIFDLHIDSLKLDDVYFPEEDMLLDMAKEYEKLSGAPEDDETFDPSQAADYSSESVSDSITLPTDMSSTQSTTATTTTTTTTTSKHRH